jgi:hypothetical protein
MRLQFYVRNPIRVSPAGSGFVWTGSVTAALFVVHQKWKVETRSQHVVLSSYEHPGQADVELRIGMRSHFFYRISVDAPGKQRLCEVDDMLETRRWVRHQYKIVVVAREGKGGSYRCKSR